MEKLSDSDNLHYLFPEDYDDSISDLLGKKDEVTEQGDKAEAETLAQVIPLSRLESTELYIPSDDEVDSDGRPVIDPFTDPRRDPVA